VHGLTMTTQEHIKRRIESTEDLQSVVKTMKALAAVNIRRYEKAAESLQHYDRTVEMALRAILRRRSGVWITARRTQGRRISAAVFGSDQGMCGQINDQAVAHALDRLAALGIEPQRCTFLAVGGRVVSRLEEAGIRVARQFAVPRSLDGVTFLVQDLLPAIEGRSPQPVHLFYNRHRSGASYAPVDLRLLPLDRQWLERVREKSWPSRALPLHRMRWNRLFSDLVRQYLFVSLFRAVVESLASENASRLASMQGAERNISDRLDELRKDYHRRRQMAITEELLDIVSGFEALEQGDESPQNHGDS